MRNYNKIILTYNFTWKQKIIKKEDVTEREIFLINCFAEGLLNKVIALEMEISLSTLDFHIRKILNKFKASSKTEVVSIAINNKII